MMTTNEIGQLVRGAVAKQAVVDMHTHLYSPGFGTPMGGKSGKSDPAGLLLWGVDELLTYHYLVAEVFRVVPATKLPYEQFWKMSKREQADHIWKHLFVERAPISEACRGVLTAIQKLGLDPNAELGSLRKWFEEQEPSGYIDRVMELSNVSSITMTNPVFDDNERKRWMEEPGKLVDSRFRAVLRIDPILRAWPTAAKRLTEWGYAAGEKLDAGSVESGRRFLRDWIDRQKAIYLALSLPPEFRYPAEPGDAVARAGQEALEKVILPVCEERGLPFAMMIGSKLQVNPSLRDGGDMVGKSDVQAVVNICRAFPKNRFLVTMLARENQHELAVATRKFGNLMLFGCWWFLNNPSLIEEITRMRVEMLGTSFVPQHSDARVLDQLLYKWEHSREVIGKVLVDQFGKMATTGRRVTKEQVEGTVRLMFRENFENFLTGK
ncbi:MAG TPA: hypothetical protein VFE58_18055 [Tepidisphaeraceae bacterium]|jgi:hypothetical protein|nr:hypothetical protein [Tepidisphaeraceae bacterium]